MGARGEERVRSAGEVCGCVWGGSERVSVCVCVGVRVNVCVCQCVCV